MIGSWKIATSTEPAAQEYGEHSLYFSNHGELVQSEMQPEGLARIVLKWSQQRDHVVLRQPRTLGEESLTCTVASAYTMQLGGSWYMRETTPFDAEAPDWALVAGAAWYGVENALVGEPFTPFLLLESGVKRQLLRIVSRDRDEAEAQADFVAKQQQFERGAWVRDGLISLPAASDPSARIDAVFVTRFDHHGNRQNTQVLPYRFRDAKPYIDGAMLRV